MNVVERKIDELIPAEYNPRHLSDKARSDLKASLKRFGSVDPAIVNTHKDRKNIIVGGHQRLKVAKELGWDKFPCVEVNLNRDQERELNIRLNKNTGDWDWDGLSEFFEVEELTDWGFSDEELFADEEELETDFKDLSDDLNETFEVIISCVNEREQEKVFKKLQTEGYECRVLTL